MLHSVPEPQERDLAQETRASTALLDEHLHELPCTVRQAFQLERTDLLWQKEN